MQNSERGFGDERSAVHAHTAYTFRNPSRVAGEKFVILLSTHKFDYAELHYKVVDKLLRLRFRKSSVCDIARDINIKKSRVSAYGHCRAVLVLYRGEIAEIQSRLLRRLRGLGNIQTVNFSQAL